MMSKAKGDKLIESLEILQNFGEGKNELSKSSADLDSGDCWS